MSNFQLGDKVTHDFSGGVGRVVGLRKAEPYTVRVKWGSASRIEKDWYKPEVLRAVEAPSMPTFDVDEANNDEEHFYVDILGRGTVAIIANDDGVSVDIYPLHATEHPVASMYVLNEDLYEGEEAS